MAASAHLLLSALSKHTAEQAVEPVVPETVPQDPPPGVRGTLGSLGSRFEAPLTSEPPLPDAEPLTSEPPFSDISPLTSESDTTGGSDPTGASDTGSWPAPAEPAGVPAQPSYPDLFRAEL